MGRNRRRGTRIALATALCILCLTSMLAASAAAEGSPAAQNETADPDVDTTITRISVDENGTARWTIEIRTRLDDEESVEEYEAYQERFRENRSLYRDRFRDRMTAVVENAAEATGREMSADEFTAETSIQEVPRRWGVVTYSFRWRNFGAVDGDAVVVGDTFEGGYFLAGGDSLVIEAPPGYAVETVTPPADQTDDGDPIWTGRRDFDDGEPAVRFVPATDVDDGADTDADDARTDEERADGTFPIVPTALALFGLCAVGGLAYAGWRSDHLGSLPGRAGADGRDSTETGGVAVTLDDGDRSDTDPDGDAADESRAGLDDAGGPSSDAALLTDEDRVRQLLAESEGRIKQQRVADEFDWSASKTSRVISSMAEEGTVEKLRIGRENVIDLVED